MLSSHWIIDNKKKINLQRSCDNLIHLNKKIENNHFYHAYVLQLCALDKCIYICPDVVPVLWHWTIACKSTCGGS